MSNKIFKTGLATAAALAAMVTAAPMSAQAQANGVTNCDAPGGRQRAGALIGAVVGGVLSGWVSRVSRQGAASSHAVSKRWRTSSLGGARRCPSMSSA